MTFEVSNFGDQKTKVTLGRRRCPACFRDFSPAASHHETSLSFLLAVRNREAVVTAAHTWGRNGFVRSRNIYSVRRTNGGFILIVLQVENTCSGLSRARMGF
jgi:hypothetical protein